MTSRPSTPMPRIGKVTLGFYALGAAAIGVKLKILSTFLLIFYNQAIGMPAALVSAAISTAIIVDAAIDPIVGHYSDGLKTRWGRRHPLIFGAALPLSVAFFLLWNPPASLSGGALYAYMLACLLVVRVGFSMFNSGSVALGPELVRDYDQRTSLVAMRLFFRIIAGLGLTILAYQYFLKPAADGSGGVTDRSGYLLFALCCSAVILVAILSCGLSTLRLVPWLARPTRPSGAPWRAFIEMASIFRNRSAAVILGVGMLTAIASGARDGLDLYFGLYFWELQQGQLAVIALAAGGGTLLGAALVSPLSRRLGKKRAAILTYSTSMACTGVPILLRLLHLMPANHSPVLFYILAIDAVVTATLFIMTAALLNSMLNDVADELAVSSGHRKEGLVFAADGFLSKAVNGVGLLISGTILSVTAFPEHAKPGAVAPDVVWRLGALYLPVMVAFTALAITLIWLFRIDRAQHADNLEKLAALDAASTGETSPVDHPTPTAQP